LWRWTLQLVNSDIIKIEPISSLQESQWRNVEGLAKKSPLGDKKSPLRGAPRSRVYFEQFVKKWPKNLNK
jgi:hypothetical protein